MSARQVKGLTVGAQKFWGMIGDPFIKDPPPYDKFDQLLVETVDLKQMNDIFAQFSRDELGKTLLLRGNTGSGKSTLLRYLHRKMLNERHFSVYCNITHRDPTSSADIKLYTHKQILQELRLAIKNDPAARVIDVEEATKTLQSNDPYAIEFALYDLLQKVSRTYPRFCFIVDDLDKITSERWSLLERYFVENQGFFQRLKSSESPVVSYNAYVVIALQPYQLVTRLTSKQLEYLGDVELTMQRWSVDEITELLEKRIIFSSLNPKLFQMSHYFDRDVIRRAWIENDANPRFCINAFKALLEGASQENVKPIKIAFVNSHPKLIKGTRDSPLFSELEAVDLDLVKRFPQLYKTFKELFANREYEPSESLECLLELHKKGTIARTDKNRALVVHGLAKNAVDGAGNLVIVMESDASAFFERLVDLLRGDQEALRPYFHNMMM